MFLYHPTIILVTLEIKADAREKLLDKSIPSNAIVQWGMYKSFLSGPPWWSGC